MTNIMVNTAWILFAVGQALALGIGVYLFKADKATIGVVYLLFHYMSMLERPIQTIVFINWKISNVPAQA